MAQSGYKNGLMRTSKGFWAYKLRMGHVTKSGTLWAEFRAVEVNRMHRLDLGASLIWELSFWVLTGLTAVPSLLWR